MNKLELEQYMEGEGIEKDLDNSTDDNIDEWLRVALFFTCVVIIFCV